MSDDRRRTAEEALEAATMETHHLANISGLDEAEQARRHLLEAQSASNSNQAHDRLRQAIEYLELARLERRDCAAGFVEARELVETALAGMNVERRGPVVRSPVELFAEPEARQTLTELREEASVDSYETLRYDVLLDETFGDLRREVEGDAEPRDPDPPEDLDAEEALERASLEMDIERSLQRSEDVESEFEFVSRDALASREEGEG